MLLFKQKFLEAIRSGEKTQTIRVWRRRMMRAGQRSYIPGVGRVRITAVDEIRLEDLSDADAVLDGFPTAADLRAELATIYDSKETRDSQAYRVAFRVERDDPEAAALGAPAVQ